MTGTYGEVVTARWHQSSHRPTTVVRSRGPRCPNPCELGHLNIMHLASLHAGAPGRDFPGNGQRHHQGHIRGRICGWPHGHGWPRCPSLDAWPRQFSIRGLRARAPLAFALLSLEPSLLRALLVLVPVPVPDPVPVPVPVPVPRPSPRPSPSSGPRPAPPSPFPRSRAPLTRPRRR